MTARHEPGTRDVVEFDCCDCGIHVVALCVDRAPEPPLCCTCIHLPGWLADPRLRAIFGDGREDLPPPP